MKWINDMFGAKRQRSAMEPLYRAVIATGRDPCWYDRGAVPDTQDGRFDMIAAVLCAVLVRFEAEGDAFASQSALLTELFIADMDAQLRELGFGDVVVGKHVGKMMGALGGRLTGYREALAEDAPLKPVIERNIYRGCPPARQSADFVETRLRRFFEALKTRPAEQIAAGQLPEPA